MKGIALALDSFKPSLAKKVVKIFTDNQGVSAILKKGSMVLELHSLSSDIEILCRDYNIITIVQWIPREENTIADDLSREIDCDDWGVSNSFFHQIDRRWGPHTVDRFADHVNYKIPVFNSRYSCPGSSAVDAFSSSWENENNWLVPPIYLISKTLKHVRASRAVATLLVPVWPSASFWPLLFSKYSPLSVMVTDSVSFSNCSDIFVHGRNHKSIFGSRLFKSSVLCVRLDGSLFC